MPKFLLINIEQKSGHKFSRNKEYQIMLDEKNYTEEGEYKEVKKLQYSSKNGIILIDGLFDLFNKDISNLIKIGNLTLNFSDELKDSFKLKFDKPKISVIFYLTKESLDIIKDNIIKLKKKFVNFDTDYKTYIKFSLSRFENINILSFLKEEEKIEIKNIKMKGKNNIKENFLDEIELKKEEEEEEEEEIINHEKNKKKNDEEEEIFSSFIKNVKKDNEEIFNPFKKNIEEKKEEEEIEKEKEKEKNIIKISNNYIKIKDIDSLKFPSSIKLKKKIISKYIPKNLQELKENILNNYSLAINPNNSYPIVKAKNNIQYIEMREIPFNEELKDLKNNYQNDILLNFLSLLYGNNKFNNKNDALTIHDYTSIILSYIKNLERKIIDMKRNNNNLINENEYIYYIQRVEKVISSLKLFQILFLNCFNNNENKSLNYEELFDDYLSSKVQTLRKKLLIEWCIEEEKMYIKNNKINIKDDPIKKEKVSLTQKIISFGQIKTAIKTNYNKNLFINAKLSNLSKDETNNIFSYYVEKQNKQTGKSNTFISYNIINNDDKKNNWISYFLQSLLYIENSNEYIIKSIKLIDEKTEKEKDFPKPYLFSENNEKEIFQLNYLLLKIYERILEENKNQKNEEEKKEENEIEKLINMFSENNLFNTNNSDHFIQYIILYILSKIINIIAPYININNFIKKKIYFLFNQIITEILSNKNNEVENLILILKLLSTLNINKKSKKEIFINIICLQNFDLTQKFWEEYEKKKEEKYFSLIDEKMKSYTTGIFYMDKCDWEKAYKCFLESENYEFCVDAYMNYCFSLLNGKNIKQINFEEIYNNLNAIQDKSYVFNGFYQDFYQLVSFIVYKDESDINEIIDLMEKYIKEYDKNEYIIEEKNHRIFVKLLYEVLLSIDRENDELILGGDEGFIKLNNISFKDKKGLLNDILMDIIYHKNNQFFIGEK